MIMIASNPERPVHFESCIEIKIKLNFYFRSSLWCLKKFYEGLLIFSLRPGLGREGLNDHEKWVLFHLKIPEIFKFYISVFPSFFP